VTANESQGELPEFWFGVASNTKTPLQRNQAILSFCIINRKIICGEISNIEIGSACIMEGPGVA
jgi:hypothetical protein